MASKQHNDATPENVPETPEGFELRSNLSPARLGARGPGIENGPGALAVRLQRPVLCGWLIGTIWAHRPEESQRFKDQNGKPVIDDRFMGELYGLNYEREEITGTDCFLPPVASRFVKAAIAARQGPNGQMGVPIAFEFWCSPNATAIRGYEYRTYLRQPPGQISAAKRMAIAAGIIEAPPGYVPELPAAPPTLALAVPDYDPETGEIETKLKDGLDKLFDHEERDAAD